MDKKVINKQIRSVSNRGSMLLVVFIAFVIPIRLLMNYLYNSGGYGSIWQDSKFISAFSQAGLFLIVYPVLYFLYYKYLNRQNGLRLRGVFVSSRRSKGWILKWTVISIGLSVLFEKIILWIIGLTFGGDTAYYSGANSILDSKSDIIGWIIYAVPIVILAPIFEELLFRATIYRNNEPMGQLFAAVVTGTAFGMWHMNPGQIFGAGVVGIFLCLIYIKTGSIYPCIFVHFANNLMVVSREFFREQIGNILLASDKKFMVLAMFHKQPIFSCLLVLCYALVIMSMIAAPIMLTVQIVKKRKGFGLNRGDFPYGALKKTLVFFSAPLTIIAFLGIILMTIFR